MDDMDKKKDGFYKALEAHGYISLAGEQNPTEYNISQCEDAIESVLENSWKKIDKIIAEYGKKEEGATWNQSKISEDINTLEKGVKGSNALIREACKKGVFNKTNSEIIEKLSESAIASAGMVELLWPIINSENSLIEKNTKAFPKMDEDSALQNLYNQFTSDPTIFLKISSRVLRYYGILLACKRNVRKSEDVVKDAESAYRKMLRLSKIKVNYRKKGSTPSSDEISRWGLAFGNFIEEIHSIRRMSEGILDIKKYDTLLKDCLKRINKEEAIQILNSFPWKKLKSDEELREIAYYIIENMNIKERIGAEKKYRIRINLIFYFLDLPVIISNITKILQSKLYSVSGSQMKGNFERDLFQQIDGFSVGEKLNVYNYYENTVYESNGIYWSLSENEAKWGEKKESYFSVTVNPISGKSYYQREIVFKINKERYNEDKISEKKLCKDGKSKLSVKGIGTLDDFGSDVMNDDIMGKILEEPSSIYNHVRVSLLYLNHYRSFREQIISFDHRFRYLPSEKKIICEQNIEQLPFFYGRKVYSLTCLVGKNGEGKTSITDFLHDIFFEMKEWIDRGEIEMQDIVSYSKFIERGNNKESYERYGLNTKKVEICESFGLRSSCKFLVVFSVGEKYYYLSNLDKDSLCIDDADVEPYEKNAGGSQEQQMKFIRFSGKVFLNGEKELADTQRVSDARKIKLTENISVDFSEEETNRQLLSKKVFLETKKQIGILKEKLPERYNGYDSFIGYKKEIISNSEISERQFEAQDQSYFDALYRFVFLKPFQEGMKVLRESMEETNSVVYQKIINEINTDTHCVLFGAVKGEGTHHSNSINMERIKSHVRFLLANKDLFDALHKTNYVYKAGDGTIKQLDIMDFLEQYGKAGLNPTECDGIFFPLSSGQYNRLAFLSKLYFFMNAKGKELPLQESVITPSVKARMLRKSQTIVLTIDEGEVYFHPEWQRRFVWDLLFIINELGRNTEEGTVQIILTTNSPFMLSDIRVEDVIKLNKSDEQLDIGKTFGQNIHTLLKNEFFMDSTIGEFSRETLIWLMELLKNPEQLIHNLKDLEDDCRKLAHEKTRLINIDSSDKNVDENQMKSDNKLLKYQIEDVIEKSKTMVESSVFNKVLDLSMIYKRGYDARKLGWEEIEQSHDEMKRDWEHVFDIEDQGEKLDYMLKKCLYRIKPSKKDWGEERIWSQVEGKYVDMEVSKRYGINNGGSYALPAGLNSEKVLEIIINGIGEDLYRAEMERLYDEYLNRVHCEEPQYLIDYYERKIAQLKNNSRLI